MTITEFLEARITEDEAEAESMAKDWPHDGGWFPALCARLAVERETKFAIIVEHLPRLDATMNPILYGAAIKPCRRCGAGQIVAPCQTVRHLAAIYSDHADYDKAWAA